MLGCGWSQCGPRKIPAQGGLDRAQGLTASVWPPLTGSGLHAQLPPAARPGRPAPWPEPPSPGPPAPAPPPAAASPAVPAPAPAPARSAAGKAGPHPGTMRIPHPAHHAAPQPWARPGPGLAGRRPGFKPRLGPDMMCVLGPITAFSEPVMHTRAPMRVLTQFGL